MALFKATVGIWTGSLAVLSSAFDSILDIVASTINYFAVKISDQPADEDHPYGHSKFEPLAAQIQSFLILFSGVFILYKAYVNITTQVEIKEIGINLIVMTFSMIVTLFLVVFLKKVAKKEDSSVLAADALHYQVDLLSNGGVMIALLIIKITGLHIIDSIVSIVIALYIIYSAIELNFSVTKELLDTKLPKDELEQIDDIIKLHSEEVVEVHRLRTRKAGNQRFIDMHLVLHFGMTLREASTVRRDIETRIKNALDNADVNIYIEPCKSDQCPTCGICDRMQGKE